MDPINVQPVPASPAEVGAPEELSQEQMRANLQELMSKIHTKYQDFDAQKNIADEKTKKEQEDLLRKIFEILKSNGIDPSNVQQVQKFLNEIKTSNPVLFQQIEQMFETLLADDNKDNTEPSGGQNPENMNIQNEESPQNI